MSTKQLRSEQLALSEVEFEWIRQYFVQGSRHHELHVWWHDPINELLALWTKLEARSRTATLALRDAAGEILVPISLPVTHVVSLYGMYGMETIARSFCSSIYAKLQITDTPCQCIILTQLG